MQTLFLQTNRCLLGGDYKGTFSCELNFSSLTSVYRQHYPYYYFTLTSTNELGILTENFTIDHYGSGTFVHNLLEKLIFISNVSFLMQ